ncbi:MAG: hypothetical protein AAF531_14050 [Actinomycetota bacterium]
MSLLIVFAAEEPNGRHWPGDINEVYWGTAAFLVLAGLIVWRGLPLIRQALTDRTERIEAELAEAKAARTEAEQALNASTADLPDVSAEEDKIRSEAHETAAKLKEDLVVKAEAEAEAIRDRGRSDVTNRKRQAQADLAAEVSRMTRDSAEAVVLDGLDGNAQSELIETYINQVNQMS